MIAISFLDKIAKVLIDNYLQNLSNTIVVLPNKRAKIFLVEALKKQVSTNILSPEIISIEEFIQAILRRLYLGVESGVGKGDRRLT